MGFESQEAGIWRHYMRTPPAAFQCHAGQTKSAVLITPIRIHRRVRALRDAPRGALAPAVKLLGFDNRSHTLLQERARVGFYPQTRHQVLEHGSGPGEENATSPISGLRAV